MQYDYIGTYAKNQIPYYQSDISRYATIPEQIITPKTNPDPEGDDPTKHYKLAMQRRGYPTNDKPLSPVDPIGEFVVANAALKMPTEAILSAAKVLPKFINTLKVNKVLSDNINKFDGTVGKEYFKAPDKWYRITETPEVQGIEEVGKNVTTRDAAGMDIPVNNWRASMLENDIKPIIDQGWQYKKKDDMDFNFVKIGSAHGNTSQAAKSQIWSGTTAGSRRFPKVILEGQAPNKIYAAYNPITKTTLGRSSFKLQDWEGIPIERRLGFHTGEMPLENLTAFQDLGNGKYSFKPVIPEKRIYIEPKLTTIEYAKPWKNGNGVNQAKAYSYDNNLDKGYFELVKDNEPNNWSVHFKTGNYNPYSGKVISNGTTSGQRAALYDALRDDIPLGDNVSTFGNVSQGGVYGLNKIGENMMQNGTRIVTSKETGKPLVIPIFKKQKGGQMYKNYIVQHVNKGSLGKNIDAQVDLPDIQIIGDASKNNNRIYNSSFDQSGFTNFINTATLGGLNNLSPTQWIRRGYDATKGKLTADNWFNGNNGIVTNKFAQNHPIMSGVTNMAGDVLGFGLGNVAKKLELYKNLNPLDNEYTRNIVYYNREPFAYNNHIQTVKAIAKDYITGKDRSYVDPPWERELSRGYPLVKRIKARVDAWRMYNKFPQKYNTFVPSEKYPGSFTAKKDIDELEGLAGMYPDNVIKALRTNTPIKYGDIDFINGSGGRVNSTVTGLFEGNVEGKKIYGGIIQTQDLWDLHPLQNHNSTKSLAAYSPFLSKFFNTRLGTKISDRIGRQEAGKIFGAKPFNVINDVPITNTQESFGVTAINKGFPEDVLNTEFGRKIQAQYPQTDFHINNGGGGDFVKDFSTSYHEDPNQHINPYFK